MNRTAWLLATVSFLTPAAAQRAQQPVAIFYSTPAAVDNPECTQRRPCSPQGSVMACQAQWIYLCAVFLADGLYLDPEIDVYHFKFVTFFGNCKDSRRVVLRATVPSAIMWVQDHATMTIKCATMDSPGVTGATAIAGRQQVIVDAESMIFGEMSMHISVGRKSDINCVSPITRPLRLSMDALSEQSNCL